MQINFSFFFSFALGQLEATLSHLMLVWVPLSHSRLHKELAAVCIDTMKTNSTVTRLLLFEGYIDDASAHALAELLKENSTLTKLDLSRNAIANLLLMHWLKN